MAENPLVTQPQNLVETFAALLTKTSEGAISINQLLAFMSLSNTMGALNLVNSHFEPRNSSLGLDSLLRGGDGHGLPAALANMLGPGGGKPNLMDLVGMLGNAMGQQGGQGKLNPQMLLSLLNMLSQLEPKKKLSGDEKAEGLGESKAAEETREKLAQEKK